MSFDCWCSIALRSMNQIYQYLISSTYLFSISLHCLSPWMNVSPRSTLLILWSILRFTVDWKLSLSTKHPSWTARILIVVYFPRCIAFTTVSESHQSLEERRKIKMEDTLNFEYSNKIKVKREQGLPREVRQERLKKGNSQKTSWYKVRIQIWHIVFAHPEPTR